MILLRSVRWTARASILTLWLCSCGGDEELVPEPGEELSGGDTTVFDTTENAFSLAARNLSQERRADFFVGNSFFNDNWVIAPSSTDARDGLGPVFNARSCSGCHFKDGRGRPPANADEPMLSMLVRISLPGVGEHGGPVPVPAYGDQLQPQSIPGTPAEGRAIIEYVEVPGQFGNGEAFSLRRPTIRFTDLAFGPLPGDTLTSARVAQANFGLGLLEAVPEATILGKADPDDRDADGISGRANQVWSERLQATVLGRFGWKANQPTLEQQTAAAFLGDIGITTSMFSAQNCAAGQTACGRAIHGGTPEASEQILSRVTFYGETLAVPGRRDWELPPVLRGKQLFSEARCTGCHTPVLQTGSIPEFPELSNQTIRPYTDLLLHDMGDGLADGRPDFEASGNEWRTPPLWGIGLVHTVNDHTNFLHDGRARNLMEAVLWHGGEASASRDAVLDFSREERDDLLRFLESL